MNGSSEIVFESWVFKILALFEIRLFTLMLQFHWLILGYAINAELLRNLNQNS